MAAAAVLLHHFGEPRWWNYSNAKGKSFLIIAI
jgi:hypothetical protein